MSVLSSESLLQNASNPSIDQLVLQYLDESGYKEAFEALQKESGLAYEPGVFPPAQLRRVARALQNLNEKDAVALQGLQNYSGPSYAERCTKTMTKLHGVRQRY